MFFKKLITNVLNEVRHFLHLIGDFDKFPYTNQYIGFYFSKFAKTPYQGKKGAKIDFLTCLFQKLVNKRFKWSSTFSSHNWRGHLNSVYKSIYWHLFLHNFKKCIIGAIKRANIDFLTRVFQKVVNKRF